MRLWIMRVSILRCVRKHSVWSATVAQTNWSEPRGCLCRSGNQYGTVEQIDRYPARFSCAAAILPLAHGHGEKMIAAGVSEPRRLCGSSSSLNRRQPLVCDLLKVTRCEI